MVKSVKFISGLWVLRVILSNTYNLCRYLQGRQSMSSAVGEMPTWPNRPYARRCWPSLSSGLVKIICALGNICHSETPNKESFFCNAKFYKIGIWTLWLFHNNLGNLQEFFLGKWFTPSVLPPLPPPPTKMTLTPMITLVSLTRS